MQTLRKILLTLAFFITSMCMMHVFADGPLDAPPPPPGGGQGGGGNGQGAPIDGGVTILMALGAGYGALKLYKSRKEKKNSEENND